MPTRKLIPSDDPRVRRFLILDDDGQMVGTDEETVRTPQQVNETTIRGRAAAALTTNATYLALPTPRTNTQVAAQVEQLTRQNAALTRLVAGLLNTTDGT